MFWSLYCVAMAASSKNLTAFLTSMLATLALSISIGNIFTYWKKLTKVQLTAIGLIEVPVVLITGTAITVY